MIFVLAEIILSFFDSKLQPPEVPTHESRSITKLKLHDGQRDFCKESREGFVPHSEVIQREKGNDSYFEFKNNVVSDPAPV